MFYTVLPMLFNPFSLSYFHILNKFGTTIGKKTCDLEDIKGHTHLCSI